jgi:hypothetical protein
MLGDSAKPDRDHPRWPVYFQHFQVDLPTNAFSGEVDFLGPNLAKRYI